MRLSKIAASDCEAAQLTAITCNATKTSKFPFNAGDPRCYSFLTHTAASFLHGLNKSTYAKEFNMSALGSLASLESIESRLLLSFASLSSHGTLSVAGTGGNDSITVQVSG